MRTIPSLAPWSITPCVLLLLSQTPTPHPHVPLRGGCPPQAQGGAGWCFAGAQVAQGCWDSPVASQASTPQHWQSHSAHVSLPKGLMEEKVCQGCHWAPVLVQDGEFCL